MYLPFSCTPNDVHPKVPLPIAPNTEGVEESGLTWCCHGAILLDKAAREGGGGGLHYTVSDTPLGTPSPQ